MSLVRVVGVDLGGTNVRAAVFDGAGVIVGARIEAPSRATEGAAHTTAAILEAIRAAAGSERISAIGMAVPGHIQGGVVRWAPNFGETLNGRFQCWRDVDLGGEIRKRLGAPVLMANDANAAAVGEYHFGSGRGRANGLVMITLGTGIGGGVVLSPACVAGLARAAALVGGNGGGAELGHSVIVKDGDPCTCGALGCLEAYCGAPAITRRATRLIPEVPYLSPSRLADLARAGDERAREVWAETGAYLGTALGNIINIFAPEVVALGGQVAKAGELILQPASSAASKVAIPTLWQDTRVVIAEQLEDAGLLGAARLAMEAG